MAMQSTPNNPADLTAANLPMEPFDIELPLAPSTDWSYWLEQLMMVLMVVALLALVWWLWRKQRALAHNQNHVAAWPGAIRWLYLRWSLSRIGKTDKSHCLTKLYGWYRLFKNAFIDTDFCNDKTTASLEPLHRHFAENYQSIEQALFAEKAVQAEDSLSQAQQLMASLSFISLLSDDMQCLWRSIRRLSAQVAAKLQAVMGNGKVVKQKNGEQS